jgi:hypothetical protein
LIINGLEICSKGMIMLARFRILSCGRDRFSRAPLDTFPKLLSFKSSGSVQPILSAMRIEPRDIIGFLPA